MSSAAPTLPFASTLCGACYEVCPVKIEIPTLLIWGDQDRVFPKEYAFAYQRLIPGAKVVIITDCGHLPHVEKGDAFAAEFEAFIGAMRIAA